MRSVIAAAAVAATILGVSACGSYGGSPSPMTPSASSDQPPADAIVINVVRENGAQSFSPNPATVPAGQRVVWHNIDGTTHRVVLNDFKLDTGNIPPGAFSAPMTLAAPGPYHCSIHPDMVGGINGQ
jgi:plastocyanin